MEFQKKEKKWNQKQKKNIRQNIWTYEKILPTLLVYKYR